MGSESIADPADIAKVVDTFVHGLADQPARSPLLSRQSRRTTVPVVVISARDFGTETPARRLEFVKHRGQIAVDIPKSVCSQVVEHRFQRGPLLGAGAIEPHGVGHVDIAQVADVFDDRPHPWARAYPQRLRGKDEHCRAHRSWEAADGLGGVFDGDVWVGECAGRTGIIFGG